MSIKWKTTALALCAGILVGCGGEESGGQAADKAPAADILDRETAFGRRQMSSGRTVEEVDRDGDGLPDRLDPDPLNPPKIVDPTSDVPFQLKSVRTRLDDRWINGTAFSGKKIELIGEGLDRAGRLWVMFQTPSGLEFAEPTRLNTDTWTAMPPEDALEAYLMAGTERSNAIPLTFLTGQDPVLYPIEGEVHSGEPITLNGRNLENVQQALFGGEPVAVTAVDTAKVVVRVPEAPIGNDLLLSAGQGEGRLLSNRQTLNLVHSVVFDIADSAALSADAFLRTYRNTEPRDLPPDQLMTLTLPAHKPVSVKFDLYGADGSVRYNAFSTVVWPGQSQVTVSSESTVLGHLLSLRSSLVDGDHENWTEVRSAMESILDLQPARNFAEDHRQAIAENLQFDWLGHRQAVIDAARAEQTATVSSADVSAASDTDYLHKQFVTVVSHRAIDGRKEYSNFTVVQYEGEIESILICDPLNPPAGIWPSDLCIENDNKVIASVAAYIPGKFPLRDDYQPVAADRVRDHVSSSQDPDVLGGNWGDVLNFSTEAYITSNDGEPLCRMHTCYIEVLTGAMGWSAEVPLSVEERRVVSWLRQRTVFESMVVPIMDELVGLTDVGEACTRDFLLGFEGYAKVISEFTSAFRAADGAAAKLDAFNSTVGKFTVDAVLGALGSQEIHSCLAKIKPIEEVIEGAEQKLGTVAKKANLYYKVAKFLDAAALVGEFVITPEKMVFQVKPRARTWVIGPDLIDMEEPLDEFGDPAMLYVVGDSIYEEGSYTPTVVFRDRYDDTARMPTDISHIPAPEDVIIASADSTQRELQIPVSELKPVIGALGAGPLRVDLEMNHTTFDDFPNQTLPVPAASPIGFLPQARLETLIPFSATPGQEVVVTGARLTNYDLEPAISLRDRNNSNTVFPAESAPLIHDDWELVFTVPNVPPGNYDVILETGADLTPLSSSEALLVTRDDVPMATLVDNGANKDDTLEMSLLDANQQVIRGTSTGVPAILSIPVKKNGELVLQDGEPIYGDSFWWDNAQLENDVAFIRIECVEPGPDEVCTFGLEMEGAGVKTYTGNETLTSYSGKLEAGFRERFTLVSQ